MKSMVFDCNALYSLPPKKVRYVKARRVNRHVYSAAGLIMCAYAVKNVREARKLLKRRTRRKPSELNGALGAGPQLW